MALYRSPLTVTLWPSSFLKKYGPMFPPAHKAHQTERRFVSSDGERSIAGGLTGGCEKCLPAVFPEVIRTLESRGNPGVHLLSSPLRPRGQLRRWMCFCDVNYLWLGFLHLTPELLDHTRGRGSLVVKVSDHGRHAMSSSPLPLKTRLVGERCTLNLSRAQTSSLGEGSASSGVVLFTCEWFKITRSIAKSPRVAEQCDANIHSLTLDNAM
ncbi:hypothetical protein TNCV_4531361 [Trichonephila clavipes]|nr:hypothetical protein TNCV_4531361 [Trichonephila clavipes]